MTRVLFPTLRGFSPAWLSGDLAAAVTLAAIAIPEQLATARLAGMPPVSGLAAFVAGTLGFALFGSNRFLSVGADSTIAPIMASALAAVALGGSAHYAALAGFLALMVGLMLVAAGLFRLGWIADLLSVPVTTGFLAGIAVHIVVGQLPSVLGFEVTHGVLVHEIAELARRLGETRLVTVAIGLGVLGAVLVSERVSARIPGALVGVAASGLAAWLFGLRARHVAMIGALPAELPRPMLEMPTIADLAALVPAALALALVCIMQTAAVVQSFPSDSGGREDVSRDFAAVGAGSVLAVLGGAFAVNASPPRTAVVQQSGGRSQIAGLGAVAVVLGVAVLGADLFAFVPQAALSGVLLFVGLRIFRLRTMREIARKGGSEILLVVLSALLVMLLPVQEGITLAVVLSLIHGFYIVARPQCAVLARVPGTTVWADPAASGKAGETVPDVLVFAPEAPVYFCNARAVCDRLMAALTQAPAPCRLVVIDASGVIDVDYTGAAALAETIADLRARGVAVRVARLSEARAQDSAGRTGLLALLGAENLFLSVQQAIDAAGPTVSPAPG